MKFRSNTALIDPGHNSFFRLTTAAVLLALLVLASCEPEKLSNRIEPALPGNSMMLGGMVALKASGL